MSDNYPPGAANDPNAPYNEVEAPETAAYRATGIGNIPTWKRTTATSRAR